MQKTLVTGCAGFIGSHVVETLLERGNEVIGIDNFNNFYDIETKEANVKPLLENNRFGLHRTDIRDPMTLESVFCSNKIDKVIHLAAMAGVRPSFKNPHTYIEVNCEGTKNLLKLSKRYGASNFVSASSSSVYGINEKIPFSEEDIVESQISPYAVSKRAGELMCEDFSIANEFPIICLRFFTVYGPRGRPDMAPLKFTKLISEGKPIDVYGDATAKRDFTYISDIVDGILASSDNISSFEIINLGNGDPTDLGTLIETIGRKVGKEPLLNRMPNQMGDVPITYADVSKAERLLNYSQKVSLEEGIGNLVDWYNSLEKR